MQADALPEDRWKVAVGPGDTKMMTLDQLDDAFRLGVVSETTLICEHGSTDWQPLYVVAGLEPPEETEPTQVVAPVEPHEPERPSSRVPRPTELRAAAPDARRRASETAPVPVLKAPVAVPKAAAPVAKATPVPRASAPVPKAPVPRAAVPFPKAPATTSKASATSAKASATSAKASATSAKAPATTTKASATTAKAPAQPQAKPLPAKRETIPGTGASLADLGFRVQPPPLPSDAFAPFPDAVVPDVAANLGPPPTSPSKHTAQPATQESPQSRGLGVSTLPPPLKAALPALGSPLPPPPNAAPPPTSPFPMAPSSMPPPTRNTLSAPPPLPPPSVSAIPGPPRTPADLTPATLAQQAHSPAVLTPAIVAQEPRTGEANFGVAKRGLSRAELATWTVMVVLGLGVVLQRNGLFHDWATAAGAGKFYQETERALVGAPGIDTPRGLDEFLSASKASRAKIEPTAEN